MRCRLAKGVAASEIHHYEWLKTNTKVVEDSDTSTIAISLNWKGLPCPKRFPQRFFHPFPNWSVTCIRDSESVISISGINPLTLDILSHFLSIRMPFVPSFERLLNISEPCHFQVYRGKSLRDTLCSPRDCATGCEGPVGWQWHGPMYLTMI